MIVVGTWEGRIISAGKTENIAFENACIYFADKDILIKTNIGNVTFEKHDDVEALFKANVLP